MNKILIEAPFGGWGGNIFKFHVCKTQDIESVKLIEQDETTLIVEVVENGKTHYELYFYFWLRETGVCSRHQAFQNGMDLIIRVFSLWDLDEAMYVKKCLSNLRFKGYYDLIFDFSGFVAKHPNESKSILQKLI